ATRVPSAPRAEPEKVRTVSSLSLAGVHPPRIATLAMERSRRSRHAWSSPRADRRTDPDLAAANNPPRDAGFPTERRARIIWPARPHYREILRPALFAEIQLDDSPDADRLPPHARVFRGRALGRLD